MLVAIVAVAAAVLMGLVVVEGCTYMAIDQSVQGW